MGTTRRFGRHGGQVRFGSTGGCRIWWAWRRPRPPRISPANAPSDRKHGVLAARSRFSGRRSLRAGSWRRCYRGDVGALRLRRCIQVGTDVTQKHSGWRVAPGKRFGETAVPVPHGAKPLPITAVSVGSGNPLLPRCCRTSACSGAPAVQLTGFGRRRCGRPLMLVVRQHAFREASSESERSERALYESGLRAVEVRYQAAPCWVGRSGRVRVDREAIAFGGHGGGGGHIDNRSGMSRQIESTGFSR